MLRVKRFFVAFLALCVLNFAAQTPARAIAPLIAITSVAAQTATGAAAVDAAATGMATLIGAVFLYLVVSDVGGNAVRVPLTTDEAKAPPAPSASSTTAALYDGTAACNTWLSGHPVTQTYNGCTLNHSYTLNSVTGTAPNMTCNYTKTTVSNSPPACASLGAPYNQVVQDSGGVVVSPTCPSGYSLSGSVCNLTNPNQAQSDKNCDLTRSGTTLAFKDDADCGGGSVIKGGTDVNGYQVAGKSPTGNPEKVTVNPTADGGSHVKVEEQIQDSAGNSVIRARDYDVASDGTVLNASQSEKYGKLDVNPDLQTATSSDTSTNANTDGLQIPTDYARENTLMAIYNKLVQLFESIGGDFTPPDHGLDVPRTDFDNAANDHKNLIDGIPSSPLPGHGWTWAPMIPTASCSPWSISAGGKTLTMDQCPVAEKVREIGGYALYVLTAFMLFNILFVRRSGV